MVGVTVRGLAARAIVPVAIMVSLQKKYSDQHLDLWRVFPSMNCNERYRPESWFPRMSRHILLMICRTYWLIEISTLKVLDRVDALQSQEEDCVG